MRPITKRTRRATTNGTGVTLAVYHASADVERHLASLRRSKRFTLACFSQHAGPLDVPKAGVDGVLWEVGKRTRPDRRRLGMIARRLPVLSYSVEAGKDVVALSKRAGFRGHLMTPLDPEAVEREFGGSPGGGFVGRLRAFLLHLKSHTGQAEVLEAALQATSTTRVPERMAERYVELAFDWLGGDGWAALAVDETRGTHWLAERGIRAAQRAAVAEMADRVARGGRAAWIAETAVAGRTRRAARLSALALPLRSHGRVVAVLIGIDTRLSRGRAEQDEGGRSNTPFRSLTASLAGALDMALRLQRANMLSSIDDLTGLFNSRFLTATLRREVKRALRTGRPLSLLFVDLDGFKGINDRHGHLCGSRALVEAADRIRSGARETDIVARFGGDEFALVLPDTGQDGAMLVARRVRERVAGAPFLAREGIGYRLTCSVGAATLPDAATTPEALLGASDAAMYRVKGRGKDGIEMAVPLPAPPVGET